jgi:hypothetical protein
LQEVVAEAVSTKQAAVVQVVCFIHHLKVLLVVLQSPLVLAELELVTLVVKVEMEQQQHLLD